MKLELKGPEGVAQRMDEIQKRMASVAGTRKAPRQIFQPEGAPMGIPGADFGSVLEGQIGGSSRDVRPMRPMMGGLTPASGGPDALRPLIARVASEEGVDPTLLEALVSVESNFNAQAVSAVGAKGLTQLMPATAKALGVQDAFDPEQNLRGGAKYLRQLMNKFGDLPTALAAYNAGPGNVAKYNGIPPFKETQNYVQRVQQRYQLLAGGINSNAR